MDFTLEAGAQLNDNQLRMTLGASGSAINPGDKAQITSLEFKDRQIIVDISWRRTREKKRLRDRIHMEVGGIPTMTEEQPDSDRSLRMRGRRSFSILIPRFRT